MRIICGARQTGKTTRCLQLVREKLESVPDGRVRFVVERGHVTQWQALFEEHKLSDRVSVELNPRLRVSLSLTKEDPFYEEIFIDDHTLSDPTKIPPLIRMLISVEHWLETPITLAINTTLDEGVIKKAIDEQPNEVLFEYIHHPNSVMEKGKRT